MIGLSGVLAGLAAICTSYPLASPVYGATENPLPWSPSGGEY